MARVIVLGSSFAGITAAYELRRRLDQKDHVLLVSNARWFVYRPALPLVSLGIRRPEEITVDFTEGLHRRGINFLHSTVYKIDPIARKVHTSQGELSYDYLVIGLGAHGEKDAVPGLFQHTNSMLWLNEALQLKEVLDRFRGGRIAVIEMQGCPIPCAAYESVFSLDAYLRRTSKRHRTELLLLSHAKKPFEAAGKPTCWHVQRELHRRGIVARFNEAVRSFHPGGFETEGGELIEADVVLAFPPYRGSNAVLRSQGVGNRRGFIDVDRSMAAIRHPHIYVVGDAVENNGTPKSGRVAEVGAGIAARNIAAQLQTSSQKTLFRSHLLCVMEMGGGRGLFSYRKDAPNQGPTEVEIALPGRLPKIGKRSFEKLFLATRF